MKKKLFFGLAVLAVVLFTVPATVPAALISSGDPYAAGSWAQRFQEEGVGNFDRLEIFSQTGAGFGTPGFQNFSSGGWTVNSFGSSAVATTGTAVNWQQFDIHFADANSSTPLSFLFYAFEGSALREAALATWNGGWSFAAYTGNYPGPASAPVPEPGTMMLLGSGLVGLAGWGRKKLRK